MNQNYSSQNHRFHPIEHTFHSLYHLLTTAAQNHCQELRLCLLYCLLKPEPLFDLSKDAGIAWYISIFHGVWCGIHGEGTVGVVCGASKHSGNQSSTQRSVATIEERHVLGVESIVEVSGIQGGVVDAAWPTILPKFLSNNVECPRCSINWKDSVCGVQDCD